MTKSGLLILFALVSQCACSGASSRDLTLIRSDSAGIELVRSMSDDVLLDLTFVPEWTAGGDSEGATTFFQVDHPSVVASDSDGNFYVLDLVNSRVVQMLSNGTVGAVFGRAGEGPGEIGAAATLAVTPGGTSSVFDFAKMALVRFGPTGTFLGTLPFPYRPASIRTQRHFAASDSEYWVSTIAETQGGTDRHELRHLRSEQEGSVVAEMTVPSMTVQPYLRCGTAIRLPRLFETEITWSVGGTDVAVSTSAQYRVDILRGTEIVRSIRRDLRPREATRELALEELGDGLVIGAGSESCTIPPAEMIDKRGYAELVPRIDRIALAPSGELWVQRRMVGSRGAGPIDLFGSDGAYLGTLPADFPFPLVFDLDGRIGVALRDQADLERLAVGRVTRQPD